MIINFLLIYNGYYFQFLVVLVCSSVYTWINELSLLDQLNLNKSKIGKILINATKQINKIPYINEYRKEMTALKSIIFESFKSKIFKTDNRLENINELLDTAMDNLSPSERIILCNNDLMKKYRNDIIKLSNINKNKNLDSVFSKILKII